VSTLTRESLLLRLCKNASDGDLVITPLLSKKQIGDASIDVRLGNQFIIFRMHNFGAFDAQEATSNLHKMQSRHIVRFGEEFILHPGTLALAATFEYIRMPKDLECQVEGRSSWARVGLQIATASSVEPGFHGVITLELSNVGTIPLKLFPGIRIAQLVFRTAEPPVKSSDIQERKYQCPIGPEFSKLHQDKDAAIFKSKGMSSS
jgi:dCTP deaminase